MNARNHHLTPGQQVAMAAMRLAHERGIWTECMVRSCIPSLADIEAQLGADLLQQARAEVAAQAASRKGSRLDVVCTEDISLLVQAARLVAACGMLISSGLCPVTVSVDRRGIGDGFAELIGSLADELGLVITLTP